MKSCSFWPSIGGATSWSTLVEQLGVDVPGLELRDGVETHRRVERDLPFALRQWLSYLWFLEPELKNAEKARARAGVGNPSRSSRVD